ncbi:MAPEG family protein [Allosphingosinicella deserti]|uniref:GST-like protein n=1 Tax=Allosphingosinicella deserti TaxID=2116704 RepID=A0A2P7QF96_9SPHN|nr:MAPEG family protein [Sphingomonas deserti]PSJ36658.1 GST-like protein [Sphingomonas deserti]
MTFTLPITLTIAAGAALINIWLGTRISRLRLRHKVSVGDGGNDRIVNAMRAQANFVEYTPFVLILLALVELAAGSPTWLWGVGALYIVGRLLHPFGLDRPAPNPLRLIGILITWLTLAGLAGYALVLASTFRPQGAVTYAQAPVHASR